MKMDFDEDWMNNRNSTVHIKNVPDPRKKKGCKLVRSADLKKPADSEEDMQLAALTYQASRHEREWIVDSLSHFFEQQWFEDILRLLKGGKEASVYLCSTNGLAVPELIAAKVYRPRRFRSLKNDFVYQEGRARLDENGNVIHNSGLQHAMNKRTEFGRQLLHTSWIEHEFKTLQILYEAGADVPRPFTRGDNAILMEYIGSDGLPAPTLSDVNLPCDEARRLFDRVIHNIDLMLAHQRVHADLSAFNILYWEGEICLIDFPQAIHPDENRNAYRIFERDVTRVCEYFARQGVPSQPRRLAADIWTGHRYHIQPTVDPRDLDDTSEKDRELWERSAW
jgi:RIO kinase 1